MKRLYNIFIESEYHLNDLFKIYYFLLRNEIPIKDMENVLRVTDDTANLNQTRSNLKAEIEEFKQIKNNLQYSQNNRYPPLRPWPNHLIRIIKKGSDYMKIFIGYKSLLYTG